MGFVYLDMKKLLKINIPDNRNFGLDLLRFIAIIMVLIDHSQLQLPFSIRPIYQFIIFDGVMVFFILSGFLIGNIIIKQFEVINFKKINNFWLNRWLRTLPAYYFVIFIQIILGGLIFKPQYWVKYLAFIQDLTFHNGLFFPESWSLSIEEWFYLLFPILIVLISYFKFNNIKYLLACCIIIITSIILRHFFITLNNGVNYSKPLWDMTYRSVTFLRLDSIAYGVLIAWLFNFKKSIFDKLNNIKWGLFGLLFLIFFRWYQLLDENSFNYYFSKNIYFTISPFLLSLAIPFFFYLKPPNRKLLKIITYVSLISYSLYLVNMSVLQNLFINKINFEVITNNTSLIWAIKFSIFWIGTFLTSIFMYKYIECPFMKLRKK